MKGNIEIICDDRGTHISVNITEAKEHDQVFLVHALGKALGLASIDYTVLAAAEAEGILNEAEPMRVSIDSEGLKKQLQLLKEEHNES